MKTLSLPTLAFAVLGISPQASALNLCWTDALLTSDQAWGRQQWARRCAQENPYGNPTGRDSRFWPQVFTAQADEYASYGVYIYPVYWDTTTQQPWLGPGAAGSPTGGYTGAQIASLPCTLKPVFVLADGICEP
ncbi:hypothetical protein ACLESD_13330 [Pyxidicoccus sp. 3LFB2]